MYTTVAQCLRAFYRLTGTLSDDDALVEAGDATDAVAYEFLTRGFRAMQLYALEAGYAGWRARSTAITTWSGTEAADGGRYKALSDVGMDDLLRLWGDDRRSALREADGTPWGEEISERDSDRQGDFYYLKGEQLWITRLAKPPSTLYAEHHYEHPALAEGGTLDCPKNLTPLAVAYGANFAKEESWLPGGPEMEMKIERAVLAAEVEAKRHAKPSRAPRRFEAHTRIGNRWSGR